MQTLEGKMILVTGASSGIGRQIAKEASQLGASLVIAGRNPANLETTASLLRQKPLSILADLSKEAGVLQLMERLPEIDGVVFCAGKVEYSPVKFIKEESLTNLFAVNFNGPVLLTRELLKTRKIKNGGSLVYVSSVSSRMGVAATGIYAASKAALTAFMKVTATECSGRKVRSNAVSPGEITTPQTQEVIGQVSADSASVRADKYPLGFGKPEDVAGMVMFLLSDASRWMTGTEIIMDGGLTLQ